MAKKYNHIHELPDIDVHELLTGNGIMMARNKRGQVVSLLDLTAEDTSNALMGELDVENVVLSKFDIDLRDHRWQTIEKMRHLITNSRTFVSKTLCVALPTTVKDFQFDQIEDVRMFFELMREGGGRQRALSQAVLAVTKGALIIQETEKPQLSSFTRETDALVRSFLDFEHGQTRVIIADVPDRHDGLRPLHVMFGDDVLFNVRVAARGKSAERIQIKMARKPEFDAEQAIGDGIGFLFEVPDVPRLQQFLESVLVPFILRGKGKFSELENNSLLSDEDFQQCVDRIRNSQTNIAGVRGQLQDISLNVIGTKENLSSATTYASLMLKGKVLVPAGGRRSKMEYRPFEMQIVLDNSQNYTGLSHHQVYDGVRRLSAASRLLGEVSTGTLQRVTRNVHRGLIGVSEDELARHFSGHLAHTFKNGKVVWRTAEHLERLRSLGLNV